jgi:GNAT superfamily N-acetyltransferase
MTEHRLMDESCVLTSCLHGGPIPLEDALDAGARPAWLETLSDLPTGTVARALRALCAEYGSCGVMAVEGDQVVGKVRFGPVQVCHEPFCVQQMPENMTALARAALPAKADLQPLALTVVCVQLAEGYRGRGLASGMLHAMIAWASDEGWQEVHARATRHIRPLLDWSGMLSRDVYEKLGFTCTGIASREALEGVQHMRAGGHGEEVRRQWEPFARLSDEEAAEIYDVVLSLG